MKKYILFCFLLVFCFQADAEDGHRLWLRYDRIGTAVVSLPQEMSATLNIAGEELRKYYKGRKIYLRHTKDDSSVFHFEKDTLFAKTDIGFLYGTYALLRDQTVKGLSEKKELWGRPAVRYRILDHWDNLDGSVERGYTGESIFFPHFNPVIIREYARANASIGINGSVLNNVNASPLILTMSWLKQVKSIADILRPYGIRVYLSVNFGSPKALGATNSADPLDQNVINWWKGKVKEIYSLIPDFGGFLVKASSEGQPGPSDYGRTHADGADMLADALAPYGGIVIWRSFVYGAHHKGEDRVMQAVSEFKDLDGKFRPNVFLQSKNGPLDFQPREPYAPIFDQMKHTPQMAELQITQEYTGQSKHLVYLGTMWKEFFSFVNPDSLEGLAGVSNVGNDANWCGHPFSQANWYAFGRMAWEGEKADPKKIAQEWLAQTFCDSPKFVKSMTEVMMTSREACVNYMMPLGLHHIFKFDNHYGPEPDGFRADYPIEWCPVYYDRVDRLGIGFDRSSTGTGAVRQYREPYRSMYDHLKTCPERYLLWFHHVPWTHRMKDGLTLWKELKAKYREGVMQVIRYRHTWQSMRCYVDPQRWKHVNELLSVQVKNAEEWYDTCIRYFGSFARQESFEPIEKQLNTGLR
ncbi:MAG: alpha-glucuronidase [Prevotella sp.]|jgi:alpha-glucuronidase|nr:alpha-glucuronidase [Prevotella sp.]MCH4216852.1 alpha-glucuronidase [Prevotella sp.]